MENKTLSKPAKTIHIVDDLDAKAIKLGYYEDVENNDKHLFKGINDKSLSQLHSIESPEINETYIYDQCSNTYIPLNENTDELFSISKLEAYIILFKYMGATELKGEITRIDTKKRKLEIDGSVSAYSVKVKNNFEKEEEQKFSSKMSRERIFGEKQTKSYEEIEKFIKEKGLSNDIQLKGRLEELRNSPNQEIKGEYTFELTLTKELNKSIDNVFALGYSSFFSGDIHFNKKFSTETEVSYKVRVKF